MSLSSPTHVMLGLSRQFLAFPEEDQLEYALNSAKRIQDDAQGHLTQEDQALALLKRADVAMTSCLREMSSALSSSSMDVWGFGGGCVTL